MKLVGYQNTDYVSFASPIWTGPGWYKVSFGCPGRVHSYGNKAEFRIPAAGRYTLTCALNGKLVLALKRI